MNVSRLSILSSLSNNHLLKRQMDINGTHKELLAGGWRQEEIDCAEAARDQIMIEGGDPDTLASDAAEDAKSRTYDEHHPDEHVPRGLFYDLKRLLESAGYDNDEAEKGVFDAVDPTWPC